MFPLLFCCAQVLNESNFVLNVVLIEVINLNVSFTRLQQGKLENTENVRKIV